MVKKSIFRSYKSKSDINYNAWIYRLTPVNFHPYMQLMRLDRPIGTMLLLLPCFWGVALDENFVAEFTTRIIYLLLLLSLGAWVMRGAGCVWNDIADSELDQKVARTKTRPIASGRVTTGQAAIFMLWLMAAGLLVLALLDVREAQGLALLSLALVVPYPFMKRFFPLPQLWLGLTFNVGALVGGALIAREFFYPPAWVLYLIGIFWTLAYDTIYALQDKEDDALLGLHSTALLFGNHVKLAIGCCYLVMILLLTGLFYYLGRGHLPSPISIVFLILMVVLMVHSIIKLNPDQTATAHRLFQHQQYIGWAIFLSLALRHLTYH